MRDWAGRPKKFWQREARCKPPLAFRMRWPSSMLWMTTSLSVPSLFHTLWGVSTWPSGQRSKVRKAHLTVGHEETRRIVHSGSSPALGIIKRGTHVHVVRWYSYLEGLPLLQQVIASVNATKQKKGVRDVSL
jgi:hypothetical protein